MPHNFNVVVLISGRGSNMESLIRNAKNYRITAVISNNQDAIGLNFAKSCNIPIFSFPRASYLSLSEQKSAIFRKVDQLTPDLVALAGFMMIVPKEVTESFYGRMINIHPSLLPDLPGLDTHSRALSENRLRHGCTVHFIDSEVDTGPIIAQAECKVMQDDSTNSLAEKVLKLEHRLYPWSVQNIACGAISLKDGKVSYSKEVISSAYTEKFLIPT